MKKIALILLLISSSFFLGTKLSIAQTDPCSNPSSLNLNGVQTCLHDIQTAYDLSVKATQPLQSELNSLRTKIQGIKDRINNIDAELRIKRQKIDKGYTDLTAKTEVLNTAIQDIYKKQSGVSPLTMFISSKNVEDFLRSLSFQQAIISHDREIVVNFALLLTDLENQKKDLESEQAQLSAAKATLDDQTAKLDKVVSGALAYQANLSSQIATLTAIQRQILGIRLSALGIPLYAVSMKGCSSDLGKPANFSGGWGFFTYGVPNRVGLNQYGAKGRAEANPPQNFDTILHAYYDFTGYKTVDPTSINIRVNDSNGYDSGNIIWNGTLDDYIRRIYEIPEEWPIESLKAQVIAARSYVMAQTNNGSKSICANQHCQVFQKTPKGGNWDTAVTATVGQVMIQGDTIITAYFSSTHGGYIHNSGGDIDYRSWLKNAIDAPGGINNWDDLTNNAYDRSSPWFYCDWGYRSSQNNTAWLQNSELADITNVVMLVQATNGDQEITKHLYQTDKPDPNPSGTDTWDAGRVKQELINHGGTPFDSVSSASISQVDWGSGTTTFVNINGTQLPGDLFKTYFNLRAPANIQIVGPLYKIEPQH